MLAHYADNWWAFLLRGIVAILFGLLLLISPLTSAIGIVLVLGVFALVDGVIAVIGAVMNRKQFQNWWTILLQGIIGIVFGLFAITQPAATGLAILWVIAVWAVVIGAIAIYAGITLRKEIENELWLILVGVLLILFGILTFLNPLSGGGILLSIWAFSALFSGVFSLLLAFRLRGMKGTAASQTRTA